MSARMCMQSFVVIRKKALGIFEPSVQIPTRTITRVAHWDPPSWSKNVLSLEWRGEGVIDGRSVYLDRIMNALTGNCKNNNYRVAFWDPPSGSKYFADPRRDADPDAKSNRFPAPCSSAHALSSGGSTLGPWGHRPPKSCPDPKIFGHSSSAANGWINWFYSNFT